MSVELSSLDRGVLTQGPQSAAARLESAEVGRFPILVRRRVEEFIEARLESGVQVAEVAERFGFSPSHFFRVFRKSFGVSPHTYMMCRRLVLAQELVVTTELSLAEIALKTGFADQSHFSRRFRNLTGVAPGEFRRQHRSNDSVAAA